MTATPVQTSANASQQTTAGTDDGPVRSDELAELDRELAEFHGHGAAAAPTTATDTKPTRAATGTHTTTTEQAATKPGETAATGDDDPMAGVTDDLVDAARRYGGMDDQAIADAVVLNRTAFIKFATGMRDGSRRLSGEFGQRGGQQQPPQQQQRNGEAPAAQPVQQNRPAIALDPVKLQEIGDKLNLDSEAIAALGEFVQSQVQKEIEPIQQAEAARAQARESEEKATEMVSFLQEAERFMVSTDEGKKRFGEGSINDVSPEFQTARREAVRDALAYRIGQRTLGREVSATDAMKFALGGQGSEVKQPTLKQAVQEAKARMGRMTVPPSSARAASGQSPKVSIAGGEMAASDIAEIDADLNRFHGRA